VKSVKSVIQHLTPHACVLIDCDDCFIPVYKQDRKSPTSPTSPTETTLEGNKVRSTNQGDKQILPRRRVLV
jgi:hypothetical protein